jgi:O-antigen ligase
MLRFYEITNPDLPVGFFANANHLATLLLCAIPFAGYLAARAVRRSARSKRISGYAIALSTGGFVAIGIAVIGSLAGYGLLIVTTAVTILIYRRAARGNIGRAWLAGVAVTFVMFLAFALTGPLQEASVTGKFSGDRTSRKVMAATTFEAVKDTFPAGTGLGSFVGAYRTYENPGLVGDEYVNHAHNDYLEFVLELGLAGLLLILSFLFWFGRRAIAVWRASGDWADLGCAGSVAILVVLLHSSVDYPVRTSAIAVVVAMACGLMVQPRSRASGPERDHERGRSSDLRHLEAD